MMYRVFDAHVDTLMRLESPEEFLGGSRKTHLDIPRARRAGVTHLVTAICAESAKEPLPALRRGFSMYMNTHKRSPINMYLMLEGCQPLVELDRTDEILQRLSLASLTWNGSNSLGGGIGSDTGLTGTGRQAARELWENGVVLDVSHLCDRSRRDLLSMGCGVVATHCNCRAVHDSPRNLPDDDLKEIAGSGGVIGITFVPSFLGGSRSMEDILRHLEHLVELVGIESAGFGSDFDGIRNLPEGVSDCGVWPDIFQMLDRRGWPSEDIASVAGDNWRRVISNS
ncbi:MAG: membrane dipeptidase [Candidatus Aegiribacteria sp.]